MPLPRAINQVKSTALTENWRLASCAPNAWATPADIPDDAVWQPLTMSRTVAAALRDEGRFNSNSPEELDDRDWWFAAPLIGEGARRLTFEGVATVADIYLDDEFLFHTDNMHVAKVGVVHLRGAQTLFIACRALGPLLSGKGARARWRPRLVTPPTLRNIRATLLGRMPGWCPPVRVIGPWRPVTIEPVGPRIIERRLTASLEGSMGALLARVMVDEPRPGPAYLQCGDTRAPLTLGDDGAYLARLTIADVRLWWPHTHGYPCLYPVVARIGDVEFDLGRVGFRDIRIDREADGQGFAPRVNGLPVFCRGAVWTTADLVDAPNSRADYEATLRRMVDANMNMVRVAGFGVYESDAFYELCDELGLMVWQDFMFSHFDYPASEGKFRNSVEEEARRFLERVQSSPSLAILCGGSEIEQQAAMMGLPKAVWTNEIFERLLPDIAAELRPDVTYIPHTPFGGPLPFMPGGGVSHYYGVGAYMRPLDDSRHARVRFAAECLGFANPPENEVVLEPGRAAIVQPCWGERRGGDVGATWFFEHVRNHYIQALYALDPERLREEDGARYLQVSRAVNSEMMEAVFAQWRRVGSPTAGGLVWFLRDVVEGAGFGILAADGAPKQVWWALKRAFRPVQVLLIDEGLNDIHAHLINERSTPIDVTLTLTCLRDGEVSVMRHQETMKLAARSVQSVPSTRLWQGFFDTGHAYRFGPPSHDVTVACLRTESGDFIADAHHFPVGRVIKRRQLGLAAKLVSDEMGASLALSTQRLALSVNIACEGFEPEDNGFHIAPGAERRIALVRKGALVTPVGSVRALNGSEIASF